MAFDPTFYALAALIVLLTGISKSGFGAGVEMLAVPALSLMILPQTAAAIMLPILVAMDAANFWRYRRDCVKSILKLMVPAALIGIVFGSVTFQYLDGDLIRLGIGLLALAFVAHRVWSEMGERVSGKVRPVWVVVLSAIGGFTSFVAHAGGPPTKIVLLAEDLPKQKFVGTNSYLFGAINLLKVFPYFYLGQFSTENLTMSATLAPFVLAGVVLGFWLQGLVSQVWFTRIVFIALFFAGIKLVFDGVAHLI